MCELACYIINHAFIFVNMCRILDGNGHAHTIHTFDVHVYASAASAIGAEDAGSNKVNSSKPMKK